MVDKLNLRQDRLNRYALDYSGAVETTLWVPPIEASIVLPQGKVGQPYFAGVATKGGTLPCRFSIALLPGNTGLAFDTNTGVLSGIPTKAFRAENVMIVVSDALGVANKVLRGLVLEVIP